MRLRAKRDLSIILGVAIVLTALALLNNYYSRSNLAVRMDKYRQKLEQDRRNSGLDLLSWNILRKTKGTMRQGPTFDEKLLPYDQQPVDIVGFMVPLEKFRQMKEFLLLPLPIECYFCQAPPMRDVVIVQMAENETTDLYKEPMLINGVLELRKGPGTKFFYVIRDAKLGPGKKGEKPTRKQVGQEHMIHPPAQQGPLLEGTDPLKPLSNLGDAIPVPQTPAETAPPAQEAVPAPQPPAQTAPPPADATGTPAAVTQ